MENVGVRDLKNRLKKYSYPVGQFRYLKEIVERGGVPEEATLFATGRMGEIRPDVVKLAREYLNGKPYDYVETSMNSDEAGSKRAVEFNSDSDKAGSKRAVELYVLLGDSQNVKMAHKRAYEENEETLLSLGSTLESLGDFKGARNAYRKLRSWTLGAFGRYKAEGIRGEARVLVKMGDPKGAVRFCERHVKKGLPSPSTIWGDTGQVLEDEGYINLALKAYEHVDDTPTTKDKKDNLRSRLEEMVQVSTAIIGLIGAGIFFSYSNITGNAIAGVGSSTGNYLGAIFLVLAIVGAFFFFRGRNKKVVKKKASSKKK